MKRQKFYALIALPSGIASQMERIAAWLDLAALEVCLERMLDIGTAAEACRQLRALLGEDPGNMKLLYCQLECARRAWDRYAERGISQEIYRDTMKCFSRFLAECEVKNGEMFFDRDWWTYRQASLRLFRVGQLEYELQTYEGEGALAVHIPSDADFSEEAVDVSLKRAETFFRTCFPDFRYRWYICRSWLLSPVLRPLLPEGSHILSFQRRFQIVQEDWESREYIEWLFQAPEKTAARDLPERTSLQKRVKELLLNGGTVSTALGILEKKG